ncbi:MAG: nuclear transport factor 2 family protein [Pseudomonadota bacterium]
MLAMAGLIGAWPLASPAAGPPARMPPAPAPATAPSPATRAQIEALLARLAGAYARKDFQTLGRLSHEKVEVQVRGLGQDRDYHGRKAVQRAFAPALRDLDSPRLDLGRPALAVSGDRAALEVAFTAWSTAELWPGLAASQRQVPMPGRLQAQLVRQGQGWVIRRLIVLLPGADRG